jgi:hypothetical protein
MLNRSECWSARGLGEACLPAGAAGVGLEQGHLRQWTRVVVVVEWRWRG